MQYHVEKGGYNAKAERDERSAVNQGRRRYYRYQVQGPNAQKLMEKIIRKSVPDIRFFNMGVFAIGGHEGVLASAFPEYPEYRRRVRAFGIIG